MEWPCLLSFEVNIIIAHRDWLEEAGWTVDQEIRVRFRPHHVWAPLMSIATHDAGSWQWV